MCLHAYQGKFKTEQLRPMITQKFLKRTVLDKEFFIVKCYCMSGVKKVGIIQQAEGPDGLPPRW